MADWPSSAARGSHQLVKIPDGVSFADADGAPVAYGTALRMMTTNGHVSAGREGG